MSNTTTIAPFIEKARKVLQYEQRNNHQDKLVKGGLELFASRWAEEFSATRKEAGLDPRPLHRFMEHLESYRQQDPLQRAANLRAALSILDEMEQEGTHGHVVATSAPRTIGAGQPPAIEPALENNGSVSAAGATPPDASHSRR